MRAWAAQGGATWGLPRFAEAVFKARFPFADISLKVPGHAAGREHVRMEPVCADR